MGFFEYSMAQEYLGACQTITSSPQGRFSPNVEVKNDFIKALRRTGSAIADVATGRGGFVLAGQRIGTEHGAFVLLSPLRYASTWTPSDRFSHRTLNSTLEFSHRRRNCDSTRKASGNLYHPKFYKSTIESFRGVSRLLLQLHKGRINNEDFNGAIF